MFSCHPNDMQSYGDSDWKMMFVEGTLWIFFSFLSFFLM